MSCLVFCARGLARSLACLLFIWSLSHSNLLYHSHSPPRELTCSLACSCYYLLTHPLTDAGARSERKTCSCLTYLSLPVWPLHSLPWSTRPAPPYKPAARALHSSQGLSKASHCLFIVCLARTHASPQTSSNLRLTHVMVLMASL